MERLNNISRSLCGQVEVLSRSGAVLRRIPLPCGTLFLGRDPVNDLILDDPYVCPHHARLHEDEGKLIVEDLGSVNGLSRAPGAPRVDRLEVATGECVRIGHTLLRYRSATAPLAPTLIDRTSTSTLRHFERPSILAGLILLAPALLLLNTYLETISRVQIGKLLMPPVFTLLAILFWAALWAFASRLLTYRWHYFIHFGIACAGLSALQILKTGNDYLCFALNLDTIHGSLGHGAETVILALLLFAHLRYVSAAPSRVLARAAALLSLAFLGLSLLPVISERGEFSSTPTFQASLKPPAFILVEGNSTDRFFTQAQAIRETLLQTAKQQQVAGEKQ